MALGSQAQGPLSLDPHPLSLTLTHAINEFLVAKARAGRSIGYLHHLRITLAAFARGPRGARPLEAVKAPEIESWLAGHHWSPKSQKGKLTDLRSFYAWCVRRQLLARNPAEAVELPRVPEPPPSLHTPEQVATVLEAARKHDANIARALAIRYFAGLRSAEANRLAEEDILPSKPRPNGQAESCSPAMNSKSWLEPPRSEGNSLLCSKPAGGMALTRP